MNSGKKRSIFPYVPGYDNNTLLKLIFFVSGAYIMLAIAWAIVMLVYNEEIYFTNYLLSNIALPQLANFKSHWWTLLTYGIFQFPNSFMELISNMLWLYCFGSVLQMLVGKKEIVPIYFYSLLIGGIFYLLGQMLPGEWGKCPPNILGPRAALAGICAAAITIAPQYRFYLTETFRVHILLVAGVFGVLTILGSGFYLPVVLMIAGGALTGFGYVKLLKAGYRPGQWMYSFGNRLESTFTPDEHANRKGRTIRLGAIGSNETSEEQKIDALLDKINRKGVNSLTRQEKDFLSGTSKK